MWKRVNLMVPEQFLKKYDEWVKGKTLKRAQAIRMAMQDQIKEAQSLGRLLEPVHAGAQEIRCAVYGLKCDLQAEREEGRTSFHRCMVEALHYPVLFKKARWR